VSGLTIVGERVPAPLDRPGRRTRMTGSGDASASGHLSPDRARRRVRSSSPATAATGEVTVRRPIGDIAVGRMSLRKAAAMRPSAFPGRMVRSPSGR
jgi:hypothetical protein